MRCVIVDDPKPALQRFVYELNFDRGEERCEMTKCSIGSHLYFIKCVGANKIVMVEHHSNNFIFHLVPDFPMMPLSAAVEPLRMANRLLGREYYNWQFSSADGEPVIAANRLQISVDNSVAQIRKAAQGLDRV